MIFGELRILRSLWRHHYPNSGNLKGFDTRSPRHLPVGFAATKLSIKTILGPNDHGFTKYCDDEDQLRLWPRFWTPLISWCCCSTSKRTTAAADFKNRHPLSLLPLDEYEFRVLKSILSRPIHSFAVHDSINIGRGPKFPFFASRAENVWCLAS